MKRRASLPWLGLLLGSLLAWPALAHDTVYYYLSDTLHSEVVITDANRNVVERTHYAPYGQVLDRSLRDGPGYTGHAEDPATGLVYMQQRYYDPQAGRFLSTDPVQTTPNGGNFNRYWYAKDNPYRYTDPDGRQTTGEYIDQQAQAAADSGNDVATYAWALAGTAWKYLGAEGLSQVVDKGAASSTSDKVMAVVAVAAVLPAGKVAEGVEDAAKAVSDVAKGAAGGERAGKVFTRAGKAEVKESNAAAHGGQTTCASCGRQTVPAQQSRAGVTPPGNETHVDHIIPKSKGGNGSPNNGQVLCRDCNLQKSDHLH